MRKVPNNMIVIVLGLLLCLPVIVNAQTAELASREEPYSWDSGVHAGSGGQTILAATQTIAVADAQWLRLQFSDAYLGRGSYITITSLEDGARQDLNTTTLWQWQNTSAYFNGEAVEVKLYVASNDEGVFVQMEEIVVGELGPTPESQCGPTDDREPSSDAKAGRLLNVGCTGWIIDNGLHVTAGHCSGGSAQVLQFNVPLSNPNGSLNHPGPEDQYAVDPNSKTSVNGGVGNDWGIFHVFDNSQTGLQPIDAQGASFTVKQDLGPATIRITGYGVDFNDPTLNQTQQTHAGPNAGSSVTTMRYVTDTEGGSSGSPVIDDASGEAVGVHTHGGCSVGGGNNNGTSTFNTAFWNALHPDLTVVANPTNPPVIIPAGGGSFDFDVMVTNNTGIAQSFDVWTGVVTPSGNTISPLRDAPFFLGPGQTSTVTLTQNVPAAAPGAQFVYIANAGDLASNNIVNTDNFLFSKSGGPAAAKSVASLSDWRKPVKAEDETELITSDVLPDAFSLGQNYPNPFNPSTTITYELPTMEEVRIAIYDLNGRLVLELVNEQKASGSHTIAWNGKNQAGRQVASGLYIYQIQANTFTKSRKMLFMK